MALLHWKPSYSLGIPAIDAEHRELIARINEIAERLDEAAPSASVQALLGEIHAGIAAHFALEERIMRQTGWHEFDAHKADHEDLLDEIRDLMDDHHADPVQGQARLQRELARWFGAHFASFDARFHGAERSGKAQ